MRKGKESAMKDNTEQLSQGNEVETEKKTKKMKKEKKEKKPMDKKKKKKVVKRCIIGGIVVIVIGYMVFANVAAQNSKPTVMTMNVGRGDVEESLNTSGTVQSERYRIYFPPAEVSVEQLHVALGDAVSAGDQLLVYDTQESEFSMNKANLQASSATNGYSGSIYDSNENATKLTDAEMNLETVEPMIESQKIKIQNMETYLEDAVSREKVKLYNEQYKLQKELNSLTEEQSIAASEGDKIGEGVYHSIEKVNNKLNEISLELTLLDEDRELTQIERDIVNEKNVLTDLETYKAKQESIRDSSETQILNAYEKRKLEAENALSQLEFEEAKKNYEEALNGITADFDGIITELNIEEGGLAAPATAVLKLESSTDVKVTFNVSKYDLEKLELGQSVEVNVSGHIYEGKVSKINRMATISSAGTPVVAAEVHIENPDEHIYLGVEAKLDIKTGFSEQAVIIPIELVNADKTGDFCYVVENGIVVKRRLVTGIASDMYLEVLEGLSEGDEVVTNMMLASEGAEVITIPNGGMNAAAETTAAAETMTAEAETEAETEAK